MAISMMTIQDWLDYLKWHIGVIQRERQTNTRFVFACGVILIGSILAIANSVYTANWIMFIVGIIGASIFGYLLNYAMTVGSDIAATAEVMISFISRIMLGKFKGSNEILAEYRRLIDEMGKKYRTCTQPKI